MAERRMFAKTIVLSDAFLDMPLSARCLYFTLGMLADDDGFINNPKSVIRQCGASDDDIKVLLSKRFVLAFENGVLVVKHWRINNYLRNDRYKETVYKDEKDSLTVGEDGNYHLKPGIPSIGIPGMGIPRLGKDRLGKDSCTERKTASVPTEPPVITLPLNDGSEWPVPQELFNEYVSLYPAVDIMAELRKMRGWLNANETRRKTKSGVKRFINGWLSKEQDKGRSDSGSKPRTVSRFHNLTERDDDPEEIALLSMRQRLNRDEAESG